ncbi:GPI transamidase [Cyclospora cayetanensis]|uniref:GPI transamidase n=1 Tax=Cyclospora cayetanensis TaxID=88456 RepID=A0A1D3D8C5_9EIME|nr:GPI transamidase [Cyclospora cayetanensis]
MECSGRFRLLKAALLRAGAPNYRLNQLFQQVYRRKVTAVADLKVLGIQAQSTIEREFGSDLLTLKCASISEAPRATKVLFECKDGVRIEAVALKFSTHTSLCISSQAGCSFNCSFCATGKIGFKRQLTVDEITDQVLYFQSKGVHPGSISFMGMGEPLMNPRVFDAIKLLADPRAFGISARRLSISTSGVLPGIKKLNEEHPQVNLAFSLHSPFTEERNILVPANRMYPFPEVLDLLDERIALTGRRVWIAYLLLEGQNDSAEHAKALAALLRERRIETRHLYHISLIAYNEGLASTNSLWWNFCCTVASTTVFSCRATRCSHCSLVLKGDTPDSLYQQECALQHPEMTS